VIPRTKFSNASNAACCRRSEKLVSSLPAACGRIASVVASIIAAKSDGLAPASEYASGSLFQCMRKRTWRVSGVALAPKRGQVSFGLESPINHSSASASVAIFIIVACENFAESGKTHFFSEAATAVLPGKNKPSRSLRRSASDSDNPRRASRAFANYFRSQKGKSENGFAMELSGRHSRSITRCVMVQETPPGHTAPQGAAVANNRPNRKFEGHRSHIVNIVPHTRASRWSRQRIIYAPCGSGPPSALSAIVKSRLAMQGRDNVLKSVIGRKLCRQILYPFVEIFAEVCGTVVCFPFGRITLPS